MFLRLLYDYNSKLLHSVSDVVLAFWHISLPTSISLSEQKCPSLCLQLSTRHLMDWFMLIFITSVLFFSLLFFALCKNLYR